MAKNSSSLRNPTDLFIPGVDSPDKEGRFTHVRPANYKFDKGLLTNIRANGVLQSVNVGTAMVTVNEAMEFREVVEDGRRRVLHAREVNRLMDEEADKAPRIMVPVRDTGDLGSSEEAELSFQLRAEAANQFRADDDQLTRAERWARLAKRTPDLATIAANANVNVQTVRAGIRVVEHASAKVKAALRKGTINFTVAANLTKNPETQDTALDELVEEAGEGGKVTTKAAKKKVKEGKGGSASATRSTKELRELCLGLEMTATDADSTVEERQTAIIMLDTVRSVLCEDYNDIDKPAGKANHKMLNAAYIMGRKAQEKARKEKKAPKKEKDAE